MPEQSGFDRFIDELTRVGEFLHDYGTTRDANTVDAAVDILKAVQRHNRLLAAAAAVAQEELEELAAPHVTRETDDA